MSRSPACVRKVSWEGIVFTTPALGPPIGGLLLLVFAHGYYTPYYCSCSTTAIWIAPYRRTGGEDGSAVHDYLSAPPGSRSRGDPVLMQRRFQVVHGQHRSAGVQRRANRSIYGLDRFPGTLQTKQTLRPRIHRPATVARLSKQLLRGCIPMGAHSSTGNCPSVQVSKCPSVPSVQVSERLRVSLSQRAENDCEFHYPSGQRTTARFTIPAGRERLRVSGEYTRENAENAVNAVAGK